jgi:hypothetical protein
MFAAPVPGDVLDLVGVGLAGRRVIQDQKTVAPVHKRLGFLPQRLRVWRPSLQQANESVMRWRVLLVLFFVGLRAGRFGASKHFLRRNQEVDVVEVIDLWRVHDTGSALASRDVAPYQTDENRSPTA